MDELELVYVVVPGEDGSSVEQLGEDAAHGPHVDGFRVFLKVYVCMRVCVVCERV